jgi:hypothetical protein
MKGRRALRWNLKPRKIKYVSKSKYLKVIPAAFTRTIVRVILNGFNQVTPESFYFLFL